ncbi:Putative hydrolase [Methanosarcina siciliae T4/M]|uniref:Putative hydrolase n=1 Tax=Methanosarcina siciliae T4/M TaxID=1434120 RepID=A0A0E3P1A8_9EURY|nr:alkyl sulfatase dimerization domain-containing protein [Methanosarcina siciliae]AKB27142.1 Putative hydrolase [Methanosarcina siciliae T4/M]
MTERSNEATKFTKASNSEFLSKLPFEDRRDFEDAARGFIAPLPDRGVIKDDNGRVVWDLTRYDFIKEDASSPETVNPSLWRQSQLVLKGGLFKVVDRLYQIRSADLSNMTIVEGDTGLIIFDPLISAETAKAALELYYEHRPKKPVVAVVHSHSHVDHYGGVRGVVSEEDVKTGKVMIIAPVGFLKAAVAENVLAGNVMSRRASYMYGNLLPPGPKGMVGTGLGMSTSNGTITLIPPTHEITETGQKMNIDGLTFEFLLAPDTEAPAEMHWYIEELKALTAAENCCHTLHNTYSMRGTSCRDPQAWSKYLNQTIDMWGDKTEVMYGMHHWPVWGKERVLEMLKKGRDGYRFINDQTLRLANHGYTPVEIAEMIEYPPELARHWAMRGYYGTLNHNVKAAYTKYLGWFDGNPATLHELPPEDAAKKYVEMMGGVDAVVEKATKDYAKGEYRWVSEVVKHVVFADPEHKAARELLADAFEQMGYQAESGPWRNFYLTGAKELREGVKQLPTPNTASPDTVRAMSLDLFFDYLGMRLNGPKAAGKKITVNFDFTDTGETAVLFLANAALNHSPDRQVANADASLTLTRIALNKIILQESTFDEEIKNGEVQVEGSLDKVHELISLLDVFEFWFNIVTP